MPAHAALLPCREVTDGPYELESVKLPVLTGVKLKAFVRICESFLSTPILAVLLRRNKMLQVLDGTVILDKPTPIPRPGWRQDIAWTEVEADCVVLQESEPAQRLQEAARVCEGSSNNRPASPWASAAEYSAAYLSGGITPSDVADAVIRAVTDSEAGSQPMRAFIAFNADAVRKQAAASTARYKAGRPLSALDGVPFAVKDTIDAMPHDTTEGTAWVADTRTVTHDAALVARLRACGAVLLGKSNMYEMGMGTTGLNVVHGTPRNPHDPARHTGGSSSGNSAALASGICPIALGTDGGGSIRIPAALCGVVGLKPTAGRLDINVGDKPPFHSSVSVFGPMGGCVRDVISLYAVLANNGAGEANPPPLALPLLPSPGDDAPLRGTVVAVYWKWFEDASPEVVDRCLKGLAMMEAAGAEVRSAVIPELKELSIAHVATIITEHRAAVAGRYHDARVRAKMNPDVRITFVAASGVTASMLHKAQQIRTRAIAHLSRVLASADFIATPTTPFVAPHINTAALKGGENNAGLSTTLMRFTQPANLTGHPALTVPVGPGRESGMPVGLQLIGRYWHEASLLRAAAVIEAAVAGQIKPPQLRFTPLKDVDAKRKTGPKGIATIDSLDRDART